MSNIAIAQMAIASLSIKERQELARNLIAEVMPAAKAKPITTRKASEILECHQKTVLRYGRLGLLKPIARNKRFLRWSQAEVERLAGIGGVA
jgi:hypothetical protein